MPTYRPLRRRVAGLLVTTSLCAALLAGCGNDNKNPASPGDGGVTAGSSAFSGIFASGGDGGTISLNIDTGIATLAPSLSRATVTATGVLVPAGGSPIALTGVYDPEADTLHVAGLGYVLVGVYDSTSVPPEFVGTCTSANGSGVFACFIDSGTPVRRFVGTYVNQALTAGGRWNMVAADTVLIGTAFPEGGTVDDAVWFEGTVASTGTMRPIAIQAFSGTVTLDAGGTWDTTDNTVSGTWNRSDTVPPSSDSGTWSGLLIP